MTPLQAASRRWTRLKAHSDFAERVREILSHAQGEIAANVEATALADFGNERAAEKPPKTD
jgi:hypothetical protein